MTLGWPLRATNDHVILLWYLPLKLAFCYFLKSIGQTGRGSFVRLVSGFHFCENIEFSRHWSHDTNLVSHVLSMEWTLISAQLSKMATIRLILGLFSARLLNMLQSTNSKLVLTNDWLPICIWSFECFEPLRSFFTKHQFSLLLGRKWSDHVVFEDIYPT